MTDHQYYNGGAYVTKSNTMNKSSSAALSRDNIHQAPYRRMEPKHLQPPPLRIGPGHRQDQPDLIKDYREANKMSGEQHGYRPHASLDTTGHHGYISQSALDSARKSQGTNTKAPKREFQIYANADVKKGEFIQDSSGYQQRSFNGTAGVDPQRSRESERTSQTPRPHSRGLAMNGSTLEVINMNYNSIQQQLERNLLPKNRPSSRMRSEEAPNQTLTSANQKVIERPTISSGRKTPLDQNTRSSSEDSNRPVTRMTQAEIIRSRNLAAAGRKTPVEPPHLRKHTPEDSSNRPTGYQQFTQDKVSPILSSSHRNPKESSRQSEDTSSRVRIPPHERTSRLTKENLEQLRKPRQESRPIDQQNDLDVISQVHPGVRQQPMGAEAVPRPATSMGFDRAAHRRPPISNEARNLAVREKLQHLQRRKSAGTSPDVGKREFATTPTRDTQTESRNQRHRLSSSGQERRKSYTTSTPAKGRMQPERPSSRGSILSRSTDDRSSRALTDSTNFSDSHRTASRLKDVVGNNKDAAGLSFKERSLIRWQEIDKLVCNSSHHDLEEMNSNNGVILRTVYPFFTEFSKKSHCISSSLDSLNQETSKHLAEHQTDSTLLNGGGTRKHALLAIGNDNDSDFQGTPQLSSPVDFDPENTNYRSSSNEDLDLEVRNLLGESPNQVDPIEMALYQKMIDAKIHEKMTLLRDRRFVLERKDNDLKFKREKLQRRMQEMLSKTTAVLNKSIELDKSRSLKEKEFEEQTKSVGNPEELSIIHALSSTIRPDTRSSNSGNHAHNFRPQHTTERKPRHQGYRSEPPVYGGAQSSSHHDKEEYV
ncbi:hypothetical protein SNE40_021992 [Patella caerulea]|uniref:Uncharacterized protein n=1 Tax=Patella caerulea TaxID=87958 RepID=A0AAN8GCB6_PATCE